MTLVDWLDPCGPTNHFTDATYTVLTGVYGTDFQQAFGVGGSYWGFETLTATGVAWEDRQAAVAFSDVNASIYTPTTPVGQFTVGLMDATATNGLTFTADWTAGLATLTAFDSAAPGHTFTLTTPVGNPLAAGGAAMEFEYFRNGVVFGVAAGEGSGPFAGTGPGGFTVPLFGAIDTTLQTALAARTLYPYTKIANNAPPVFQGWGHSQTNVDYGVSNWHYESEASPALPDPHISQWTYGPQAALEDQFTFTNSSMDGSYPITKVTWTLADGTVIHDESEFIHVFPSNGQYLVSVQVWDAIGRTDTFSTVITVSGQTGT